MSDIDKVQLKTFEEHKKLDDNGNEFWYARELMVLLGYERWANFEKVVVKARVSIENAQQDVNYCIRDVERAIITGKNTRSTIKDFMLNRYACYIIAQNGDPRKEEIALAQSYFAYQTRKQELAESFDELSEDSKRLAIRRELIYHNKSLAEAANEAGVITPKQYAYFQNSGYRGLYGGLDAKDIHSRKGLKKSQKILDHMGSTELAANLFRATQTDEKLRREKIYGVNAACNTHFAVGKKVRQTIAELGGTMPEDLPTPDRSIAQIEREQNKKIKE